MSHGTWQHGNKTDISQVGGRNRLDENFNTKNMTKIYPNQLLGFIKHPFSLDLSFYICIIYFLLKFLLVFIYFLVLLFSFLLSGTSVF